VKLIDKKKMNILLNLSNLNNLETKYTKKRKFSSSEFTRLGSFAKIDIHNYSTQHDIEIRLDFTDGKPIKMNLEEWSKIPYDAIHLFRPNKEEYPFDFIVKEKPKTLEGITIYNTVKALKEFDEQVSSLKKETCIYIYTKKICIIATILLSNYKTNPQNLKKYCEENYFKYMPEDIKNRIISLNQETKQEYLKKALGSEIVKTLEKQIKELKLEPLSNIEFSGPEYNYLNSFKFENSNFYSAILCFYDYLRSNT
jgi:hypothetical protein